MPENPLPPLPLTEPVNTPTRVDVYSLKANETERLRRCNEAVGTTIFSAWVLNNQIKTAEQNLEVLRARLQAAHELNIKEQAKFDSSVECFLGDREEKDIYSFEPDDAYTILKRVR